MLRSALTQGARISVSTLGKDDPTNAEQERTQVVLSSLQKTNTFMKHSLPAWIFLGRNLPRSPATPRPTIRFPASRPLNSSQTAAVERILSGASSDRVCLIQGPPGTGKTTVIAASVHSFLANPMLGLGSSMWLIAQSNVAVKNIAEKLAETKFLEFRLLVSVDFHFEWYMDPPFLTHVEIELTMAVRHEHLYAKIEENTIRSDQFSNIHDMIRRLAGSRVILCTLSMLSHPLLATSGVFRIAPVNTVIVDEASQIEIGDYFPLLSNFRKHLKKLVFIGDNKQRAFIDFAFNHHRIARTVGLKNPLHSRPVRSR